MNETPPLTANETLNDSYRLLKTVLLFIQLWAFFYNISATAMNHLFQFLHHMFTTIVENSLSLTVLESVFPTSLYKAKKIFSI